MRALFDHPWWLMVLATIGGFATVGVVLTLFFALGRRPKRMWADAIDPVWSLGFVRSIAALLDVPYRTGGTVKLLNNGDQYFTSMIRDIGAAQRNVHMMSYIWESGATSDRFIEALIERVNAGVQVRVLLDGLGGMRSRGDLDRLIRVGGSVATFRPATFGKLLRFHRRNHRRAIVIDGSIAFTGGAAIGDKWAGNARNPDEWRDTMVRVEGCPAENLQSSFVELWASCTGEVLIGDDVFPPHGHDGATDHAAAGHVGSHEHAAAADGVASGVAPAAAPAGVHERAAGARAGAHDAAARTSDSPLITCGVISSPSSEEHPLRLFFFLSFLASRERLWITTPYFVPDRHTREVVMRRARAGVDVRILLPNRYTDARPIRQASRSYYAELMNAGVRIYEYQTTMMHTKGVVVDGHWSVVGSANMDIRSKELNKENVLGILDVAFATEMERTFLADLEQAVEIDRVKWRERGIGWKLVERVCVMFAEQY